MQRIFGTPPILLADGDPEERCFLEIALQSAGFSVHATESGEDAVAWLKESPYILLLLDLDLNLTHPRPDELLREIRKLDAGLPIIAFSSASLASRVINAIRSGATDFLPKPVIPQDLIKAIQRALRPQAEMDEPITMDSALPSEGALFASSSWTKKLDLFLRQVGASDAPALVQGETGVGKEVLARQLHAYSPRAKKPLLKLNCAALPSELIESELFGYERGAFTGAFRNSPGKFEVADGGTILLDEIGDMDFKLQAKLLQVVEDGEFFRLGGTDLCQVDVRVIAATHCDLEQAISDGRFREDLYYRLNIIHIEVPPLRDRKEEILPLADFFIKKHSKPEDVPIEIGSRVRQILLTHSWPGNIRELENVIRRMVMLRRPELSVEELRRGAIRKPPTARGASLSEPVLPKGSPGELGGETAVTSSDQGTQHSGKTAIHPIAGAQTSILRKVDEARKQAEVDAIVNALNASLWNRKDAAALLNVEYKALLYKMKKLGVGGNKSRAASL